MTVGDKNSNKSIKHVFVVHSNITEIVMFLTIKKLGLRREDILVFTTRGYMLNTDYAQLEYGSEKIEGGVRRTFFPVVKRVREITRSIKTPFYIYLPQSYMIEYALLIAQRRCLGYYYIEEGLAAYLQSKFVVQTGGKSYLFWVYRLLSPWVRYFDFRGLIHKACHFNITHPRYRGSFALGEKAFYFDPKREYLPIAEVANFPMKTQKEENFDCVVVFDACVIYRLISMSDGQKLLKEVIFPFLQQKGYKSIAYKLHPEHYANKEIGKEESDLIRSAFSEYIPLAKELDRNFSLETYYAHHPESDIVVFYSSVGYYASLFGASVYSLHKRLYEINKEVRLPEFLDEVYTDI